VGNDMVWQVVKHSRPSLDDRMRADLATMHDLGSQIDH
jgi:predicted unusual protein kinase regulating ubiquinone biosynthesis (AarF/ABC1/UbiB family)